MEWSEELCGGLLRAAPDAIVVVKDATIVLVNDRAQELFGFSREELIGQPVDLLLTDSARVDYPGQLLPGSRDMAGGPMGTLSLAVRRKDGAEFPVEVALSAVPTDRGRVVMGVIRDISDRLHAEAERAQLRVEADQQRVEAQLHRNRRLESLGQFAGGVAHDFNNMLGVIVNYAGFVIEEATAAAPDVGAIAADAEQIVRAGQRATDLTHQLLAFARREVVRPEVLDLNRLVADAAQLLRRTLGGNVTLVIQPGAELPPITADPGQIEQILVNLVLNARDAMPTGGRLIIDTSTVHVDREHEAVARGAEPGEYVCLRAVDSGSGMAPDVVERAFEPFYTTKRSGEGTGLGLATVYGIVSQAGGDISLASEPGAGTTVTVLLPAAEAADEPPATESDPPVPAETAGHGETLLVAEDEAPLRDVVGRILCGAGYQVLSADGGAQALELAARHDGRIDLLVSDVVMPGMLGKDLAERLVAVRPDTRVLYMSGYAQPVLASEGTLDPGVMLLEKPFTADDLLRAVRDRLDGG
ncbi:MAG TPA: ATP-binding protein [Actinoplanes sp.]|nr:ATP-binding protein [Actinoplanes sp.]